MHVSLRSVGNWERGGAVPRKYWEGLREILPAAWQDPTPPRGTGVRDVAQRDSLARDLLEARKRASQRRELGLSAEELAEMHLAFASAATRALDFAEQAIDLGVHYDIVKSITDAVVNAVIDSGTLSLLSQAQDADMNPIRDYIDRTSEINYRARLSQDPNRPPAPILRYMPGIDVRISDEEQSQGTGESPASEG